MKDEPNYRLNCGQYVLHHGDKPVGAVMDEVAIAVDRDGPVFHKHGPQASVEAWANAARARLRTQGELGAEMAENLVVITGRFPVAELNKLIQCSGYITAFLARLDAGTMPHQPLLPGLTLLKTHFKAIDRL